MLFEDHLWMVRFFLFSYKTLCRYIHKRQWLLISVYTYNCIMLNTDKILPRSMFLKPFRDCESVTWFGNEFQSKQVRRTFQDVCSCKWLDEQRR